MPLNPGARLGPYEITSPLGAGGMGEVYRARDTRLGREVAVKVLPPDVAASSGSRERFEREAQVVSSLQHRNICTLHDVGREGETDFLVMELLDGETLAARLDRGPMKLDEALAVGAEIASALDAAHRAGVVHRDLKPGNVMLTRGGAKVLDFGIAKLAEPEGTMPGRLPTMTPTRTTPLTSAGALVGTLNYMAPEQLEGRGVDARSDIFAFGAVLYEMLTGRRAFDGASQASVIAAILERDPAPVSSLVPVVPAALDRLVRACLAKDPDRRRQSAHDVAAELSGLRESPLPATGEIAAPARRGWRVPWPVSAIAIIAAGTLAALLLRRPHADAPARVVEIAVPTHSGETQNFRSLALSPDGTAMAFADQPSGGGPWQIRVRRVDQALTKLVEGTEFASCPFFSPDGKEIGFFSRGKLRAVPLDGGRVRDLCDASYGVGASWGPNGIVFSQSFNQGLRYIDRGGGRPVEVTTLDTARKESGHLWPVLLPDGKHFLFLSRTTADERSHVEIGSIDKEPRKVVMEADALVGYQAPWLLYVSDGAIYARRFDPATGAVSGERRTVADDAYYNESWASGGAAVAGDVLAWVPHHAEAVSADWYAANGAPAGHAFDGEDLLNARVSPDGTRVGITKLDPARGAGDIWVMELSRGLMTRLTKTDGDDSFGAWFPDGSQVGFSSDQRGAYAVYRVAADGSGGPTPVTDQAEHDQLLEDVSPDGKTIYFRREGGLNLSDLWSAPVADPRKAVPWIATPDNEDESRISPDGRWVAYVSTKSGSREVYLRRVEGGPVAQVSVDGGSAASWELDGKGLRYIDTDNRIRRVPLTFQGDRAIPGIPDRGADITVDRLVSYSLAPGGRVLVLRDVSPREDAIVMRLGWTSRLH